MLRIPPPLTPSEDTATRLLACLAGLPDICSVRQCRRKQRCLGRGFACMHRHGDKLVLALATAVADHHGARNAADLPELLGKWRE